jgi:hypothetical protein
MQAVWRERFSKVHTLLAKVYITHNKATVYIVDFVDYITRKPIMEQFLHATCKCKRSACWHLENAGNKTLPGGPGLHLLALSVDEIPVKLATAGIDVHLSSPEPTLTLPEVTGDPEGTDDKESEVGLEEILSGTDALSDGRNGSVELLTLLVFDSAEGVSEGNIPEQ